MKQLMTKWGNALDEANVKPEYPRPNLVRESYLNLNGLWDCCINSEKTCGGYDRTILVPFSPESALSGVGQIVRPENYLHYRKKVTLPDGFNQGRVLLHFGAVDQECTVFFNGQKLGEHFGGYLPFSFDVTDALTDGENVIELTVRDQTEKAPYPRGKQRLARKGMLSSIFYTPCSGIWKTVWMESVPPAYVTGVRMNPRYDDAQIELEVRTNHPGKAKVTISFEGEKVCEHEIDTDKRIRIGLPGFKAWSPDEPNLYDVTICCGEDCVRSYFGMRVFEYKKDPHGILRFYLNKRPFFFNGLLDQGYWPDGLLTPACDAAHESDIRRLKDMGFNTLRKHIKIEEERFYYLCDKIGMIVWQDMPNGGGAYNMFFVAVLSNAFECIARGVKDSHYKLFAREDVQGREQFYRELTGMIELLYNYPCIALWTPFNEGWGQFDARKATEMIRGLDPDRLINEACGWFDQGGGDLFSIHNYMRKLKVTPKEDRVVALTEFGGYAYPEKDHIACEKEFGYRAYQSREELTRNYKRLWDEEIYPNLKNGLSAAIYTQVSDVEEEINGVFTYDREVVKLQEDVVQEINRRLYEEFDALTR
ncbi:MAG: glycoside hydrolase family 2 [Clostridia bacterium]|nr:glycoside hydrolase family 2 [Clostridia bacterium]